MCPQWESQRISDPFCINLLDGLTKLIAPSKKALSRNIDVIGATSISVMHNASAPCQHRVY